MEGDSVQRRRLWEGTEPLYKCLSYINSVSASRTLHLFWVLVTLENLMEDIDLFTLKIS